MMSSSTSSHASAPLRRTAAPPRCWRPCLESPFAGRSASGGSLGLANPLFHYANSAARQSSTTTQARSECRQQPSTTHQSGHVLSPALVFQLRPMHYQLLPKPRRMNTCAKTPGGRGVMLRSPSAPEARNSNNRRYRSTARRPNLCRVPFRLSTMDYRLWDNTRFHPTRVRRYPSRIYPGLTNRSPEVHS
jgi:hypothetical protein